MQKFFKYPILIVAVIAAITVFFAAALPRAELDNNNFRFVPENDPARITSAKISDTFGSSLFILVGLEREYGDVFDPVFLARVKEYCAKIEKIDVVDNVNSMVTADYLTGKDDAIIAEKLVADDFSGTREEAAALRQKLRSWPLYDHALVSGDASATQILVKLKIATEDAGSKDVEDSFLVIRDTAREMFSGESKLANVYVAGLPVISATINEAVKTDLRFLIPLVVIVVLTILFFSFRGFTAVALPLLTVIIATIWSIGAMPYFGVKLSLLTTVLPVILVAVGSAYGIHVITHYDEECGEAKTREEHRQRVFALLGKIGKPVFLAALTTFAGFISFCFTSVVPIREFGIFASFGVAVSFIVAVTLIPALFLIRGPARLTRAYAIHGGDNPDDNLSGAIASSLISIVSKKRFVLSVAAVVVAFSLYGVSKIIIDNVMIEYFKSDTDVRRSDVFIREQFGGSKVVDVVVEADSSAELLSPKVLGALDGLQSYLEKRVPSVGKVMGFTDMVKRMNQVFNADESPDGLKPAAAPQGGAGFGFGADAGFGFGAAAPSEPEAPAAPRRELRPKTTALDIALVDNAAFSPVISAADLVWELKKQVNYEGASYYEIPVDPARYGKSSGDELSALVSNYLVLLSGDIHDYANDPLEPTALKMTVQMRTTGDRDTRAVIDTIRAYCAASFPSDVRVTIGGSALVESSLNGLVVQSQIVSVALSILIVFIIIALSNKSLVAGLVGGIPLIISILINFAVMGFLGIKLNIGTSLVASVSVGIGIDYTIHFMESYKREWREAGGSGDFLRRAFTLCGKAIMINAISVGAGFIVLAFSRFNILADFGLLIALTMFTSALISLTVIPALLLVLKPKFVR